MLGNCCGIRLAELLHGNHVQGLDHVDAGASIIGRCNLGLHSTTDLYHIVRQLDGALCR